MIAKGTTHNNGGRLAAYMTTGKTNERAELWELRGFGMADIADAFRTVHVIARDTKAEQPFFHVQVRNREGETLTRPQWEHAADRIEGMLGLKDQPRAIAFHTDVKTGHEHMHVAWSRIDEDTMKAIPQPFFKYRLKKISRELEAHFALAPVTNEREGEIKFAPTRAEHEQARRLGQDVHEVRNTIRDCWDRSDCGQSFQAALEDKGFTLAQGERRDFVVIDPGGGLNVLSKRILDVTAAKIRERLSGLSRDDLPTVAMARAFLEEIGQEKPLQQHRETTAAAGWDRDRYDRAWQNSIIDAAIEKEKSKRDFIAPDAFESNDLRWSEAVASRKHDSQLSHPKPKSSALHNAELYDRMLAYGYDATEASARNKWRDIQMKVSVEKISEKDGLREMGHYLWEQADRERRAEAKLSQQQPPPDRPPEHDRDR